MDILLFREASHRFWPEPNGTLSPQFEASRSHACCLVLGQLKKRSLVMAVKQTRHLNGQGISSSAFCQRATRANAG